MGVHWDAPADPGKWDPANPGPGDTTYYWNPGMNVLRMEPFRMLLSDVATAYDAEWSSDSSAAEIRPCEGVGPLNSEIMQTNYRLTGWPLPGGLTAIVWAQYGDKAGTAAFAEFLSSHSSGGGDLFYQRLGTGPGRTVSPAPLRLTPWNFTAKKVTSCALGDRRLVVWVGEQVPLVIPGTKQGKREERLYARVLGPR
jgi:hypothetical protein